MKNLALFLALVLTQSVFALPVTVTIPDLSTKILTTMQVPSSDLGTLAENQHHKSSYCGGFVASFNGEVFDSPFHSVNFAKLALSYVVELDK
jgi:hypothetical protein